jgi:CRISP-associated protein Cas1
VTTDGAYLAKEGEAVVVRKEREVVLRVPIHLLHSVVCLGHVGMSPQLMALCAERGVSVSFHRTTGKLLARVTGFTPGNVLLRKAQFRASEDTRMATEFSRAFVGAKIANSRVVLLRAARDHGDSGGRVGHAAESLRGVMRRVMHEEDLSRIRGLEGEAASTYFRIFPLLLRTDDSRLAFLGRSRRPPADPPNALLSFAYAILASDVRSACESVGLDSQIGFLHVGRPGRPALALDLMEELRPVIADRVALSLLNRRQLDHADFKCDAAGAFRLTESGRKTFLSEFQRRKTEEIEHPFLGERVTLGAVPFLQARLLAKALRGEIDGYPPFFWR